MTLPLLFNAAAAEPDIFTETTSEERLAATALESPSNPPHVTRLPLLFNAAKASNPENISTTFVKTTEEDTAP